MVPVRSPGSSSRMSWSSPSGTPTLKVWRQRWPRFFTSTIRWLDSALTTLTPTPWRPPDTLYPPPPNLPPAWSTVSDRGDGRQLLAGCGVGRDTAAVVLDADTTVGQEGDHDPVAVAGQRLVDGVVDDLPDQVVEAALTGRADVHARALADRLETLEDLDRGGVVLDAVGGLGQRCCWDGLGDGQLGSLVAHAHLFVGIGAAGGPPATGVWHGSGRVRTSARPRCPMIAVSGPLSTPPPRRWGHLWTKSRPRRRERADRRPARGCGQVPVRPRCPQIGSAGAVTAAPPATVRPGSGATVSRRCREVRGRRRTLARTVLPGRVRGGRAPRSPRRFRARDPR